jgi:hypothetical protein
MRPRLMRFSSSKNRFDLVAISAIGSGRQRLRCRPPAGRMAPHVMVATTVRPVVSGPVALSRRRRSGRKTRSIDRFGIEEAGISGISGITCD